MAAASVVLAFGVGFLFLAEDLEAGAGVDILATVSGSVVTAGVLAGVLLGLVLPFVPFL